MPLALWQQCLDTLQDELNSQQFNTWIRPLQAEAGESGELCLLAPNRFVRDWVSDKYAKRIGELMRELSPAKPPKVVLSVGSRRSVPRPQPRELGNPVSAAPRRPAAPAVHTPPRGDVADEREIDALRDSGEVRRPGGERQVQVEGSLKHSSGLNPNFTFETFVEGKSNQLARAASRQVSENPGGAYNPLFLYGGVGLGKTHLMHAVGNALAGRRENARVVYLHSERFVADMVKALQLNAINDFKRFYRSVDALLIDDIQFFAGKERSQEEFFHTFNALLEGGQQMILTSDRYPKEISGVEERLKSRFGWGLTVAIEPPELETRVAILMKKADQAKVDLPHDAAFFIAQKIRSNVRELEGALKKVIADSHFMGRRLPRTSFASPSRIFWPCRTSRWVWITFSAPWPSTIRSSWPTCSPSAALARWLALVRSPWPWPRSSPTTAFPRSATPSVGVITPRYCTPAARCSSSRKRAPISVRTTRICCAC